MNTDKTEFILFGFRQHLSKCSTKSIDVCGNLVECSEKIKLLRTWLDRSLSFKYQIDRKCCIAMFNIQKIRHIRQVLTMDACLTLVFGLVTSHLDYANALYLGLPTCDIAKLQQVQNAAAKLVLNRTKYDSATEALKELHWLPIKYRDIHKLLTLVHKSLKDNAPKYLQDLLHQHHPGREGLQSSNEPGIILTVPRTKQKTFAGRSFSVTGPNCGIVCHTTYEVFIILTPLRQN